MAIEIKGNQPQGEQCGNCLYHAYIGEHGICRQKPPKTFVIDAGNPPRRTVITRYPEVNKESWCGKFCDIDE